MTKHNHPNDGIFRGRGTPNPCKRCILEHAAPDLLEACKYAEGLVKIARQYFPKSIRNSDKFQLENICATIGKAIYKAEEACHK